MKGLKTFAVFAVVFAMILGGAFATFDSVTFYPYYDGTRNTTDIWSDRNPTFKITDSINTGADLYIKVGQEPTFVWGATHPGGSFSNGEELPPLIWNDTLAWDNSTLEAVMGVTCSDPAYFCTQNLSDFEGMPYIHNETRFDQISGYGFLSNNPPEGNISQHRNQVTDFWLSGQEDNSEMILNESLVLNFSVGLWSPMQLYKNEAQGIAMVVLPKTPTYYAGSPNVGCSFRFAENGSSDFFAVENTANGNCTMLADRDFAIVPWHFFNGTWFYRIMPNAYKIASVDGRLDYLAENRRNERGSAENPLWTAVNFTEFISTSCDLRNYYVLPNGACVLYGTAPPAPPTGMFLLLNGGFIQAVAGIAMAMVAMFVMISYTKGKDGTKDVNDAFEFFGRWGEK